MWGGPLDVDEPPGLAICERQVAEANERALGCVGRTVEHRLSREQPTEGQTIETTQELPVAPCLDRVRPSELVQAGVRRGDLRRDPASVARRISAGRHYLCEFRVDANLKAT